MADRFAELQANEQGTMLHHASLPVEDLERAAALYDAALAALGYRRVANGDGFVGYGTEQGRDKLALLRTHRAKASGDGLHLALAAPSREAVDAFHEAALRSGATDNGGPGLRPHYGPTYYAAFIVDCDGHRIEAVHNPPEPFPRGLRPAVGEERRRHSLAFGSLLVFAPSLDEARRFYGGVLGLEVERETEDFLVFREPTFRLAIFRCEEAGSVETHARSAASTIVFTVPSLESAVAELARRGVRFLHEAPASGPLGRYVAFADPFGTVHELMEAVHGPPEPSP